MGDMQGNRLLNFILVLGKLFALFPNTEISKLQGLPNAAVILVTFSSKFSHVTPVLYELHWLPVRFHFSLRYFLRYF